MGVAATRQRSRFPTIAHSKAHHPPTDTATRGGALSHVARGAPNPPQCATTDGPRHASSDMWYGGTQRREQRAPSLAIAAQRQADRLDIPPALTTPLDGARSHPLWIEGALTRREHRAWSGGVGQMPGLARWCRSQLSTRKVTKCPPSFYRIGGVRALASPALAVRRKVGCSLNNV